VQITGLSERRKINTSAHPASALTTVAT